MVELNTSDSSKAPKYTQHESAQGVRISPGPFIGVVYNNVDPMRSGRLQVYIPELGGDPSKESSLRTVAYASPFFGTTPPRQDPETGLFLTRDGQSFATNPHSYGMWMVPPDLGTKVLCMFVNGDPFKGYWFACVPDWPNMHMVPAIGTPAGGGDPVVEYNQDVPNAAGNIENFFKNAKTAHDVIKQQYSRQGLLQDSDRGPITSSAFRETPSAVFGISTPGKKLNNNNGRNGGSVDRSGVGRKGGHSIVMDDGDEGGGSQLMRFRTAGGHQLMMHDSGGFIYITNQAGTAWLDMDDAGNINIWCKGQFNVKADGPIQLESGASVKIKGKTTVDILADGTANLTGKGGINLSSPKLTKVEGKDGLHLKGKNAYLTGDSCVQINGGKHMDMSAGCITINSKSATKAQGAQTANPPSGMPTKEPWSGHKRKNSGTSIPGVGSAASSTYGKAADYTKGVNMNGGSIGQTGGVGPGPTGFRQGTESAQLSGFSPAKETASSAVNTNIPPEGRALLDTIASTESPGYNVMYGGKTFSDYSDHPRVAVPIMSGPNEGLTSSAAGRYQFLGSTWDDQSKKLGLKDFSPANQDAAAWNLAQEVYKQKTGGDLLTELKSGDPQRIASAGAVLNKTWTSLPGGIEAGTNSSRFANAFNANNKKYSTADTQVKPSDTDPNSKSTPAVTPTEPTQSVGYVPPGSEQAYRDQLRAENKAGADYGAPVIKETPNALDTKIKQSESSIQYMSEKRNEKQLEIARDTEKLGALEADYQAGFIDRDTYERERAGYESRISANTFAVENSNALIDRETESLREMNRAQALSGNPDEYANSRLVTADNTFGDSPLADNTAANYQTPQYDANGNFTGMADTSTALDRNDFTVPMPDYQSPTGEELTAQIAAENNMQNFNNMPIDSVDPWTTAPNIVQDQAVLNATDDYGNRLGGPVDTGSSSSGGEMYGPFTPNQTTTPGGSRDSSIATTDGVTGGNSSNPITGSNPAPGQGGTGTPGAPGNNAPQSPAKPAC